MGSKYLYIFLYLTIHYYDVVQLYPLDILFWVISTFLKDSTHSFVLEIHRPFNQYQFFTKNLLID